MKTPYITMIIPTIPKDYTRVKRDYKSYFDYLPIDKIVYIGPSELEEVVKKDADEAGYTDRIEYINENDVVPYANVRESMVARIAAEGYEMDENSKPGWYYQQFLKMEYARLCENDYYMSWDSDTLPLRKIKMFNDKGKPYLDTKAEYNPGYFRTIRNLFGMDKAVDDSFIAEHMLFRKDYMIEMIGEIEQLPIKGNTFYEKILYSIDIDNMRMGFSEFETYGTWVINRHPDAYAIRLWKSMRRCNIFTSSWDLTPTDRAWLARDYDAASFESYHPTFPELAKMFRDPQIRRSMSARELYLRIIKSGVFGEYVDGTVKDGELLTPI